MDEKIVIQQRPPKSPAAAGILSIILPGLGNLYNGLVNRFFLQLVVTAGLIVGLVEVAEVGNALTIVFTAIMLGGFWFYQIIDSINVAKAINLAAAGQKAEELAKLERPPQVGASRSVFWGIILIILGILVILMNFDWIAPATFYTAIVPAAVIVIGVKLVFDSMTKSKNGK